MRNKELQIISIITLLGFLFSFYLILQLDTFGWDEAHHAFFSNQIYRDLISFNVGGFFAHTSNQAWFQPFHSWLNALFFIVLGRSYLSANLSSLSMYLLLFFLIYKYSLLISKEKGPIIAVIADSLLLTSPFMLFQSSVNMQEMMGAVVILLSLIYYITKCKVFDLRNYLILGFILSLVMLVKYHYLALLGITVFLMEVSRIFDLKDVVNGAKHFVVNGITILAGFIPLSALWFFTPPVDRKWALLFYRVGENSQGGISQDPFTRILFYAQSIISSYTFSLWIGIFLLFAIIYSFRYFNDIKVRTLSLLMVTFFIFHSIISLFFVRLLCPVMPAVFILAGYAAVDIYFKYVRDNKRLKSAITIIIIALVIGDLVSILPFINSFTYNRNIQALDSRTFFGLVSRPIVFFPQEYNAPGMVQFKSKPKEKLRDLLDYCSNTIPKDRPISTLVSFLEISPYEWYWHFSDWKANVLTVNDYPAMGKYFWFSEYFIELEIKDNSPYISEVKDGGKSWRDPTSFFKQKGWLTLFASKDYNELGITVNIYKMKLPY